MLQINSTKDCLFDHLSRMKFRRITSRVVLMLILCGSLGYSWQVFSDHETRINLPDLISSVWAAPAQPSFPRLAVLDFRDDAGLPPFERNALADSVRGAALGAPFMVITKENMVALLPPGTDLASCVGECEVDVGRKIGARYLITGQTGMIDGHLQLLLRLYDTESGELRGQATLNAQSVGAMQPQVRRAATRMLAELSPALRQVSPESRTLLFVRIKPSRAQVKLDGFIIPKSKRRTVKGGFLIPVKPGRHEVSARAAGYTPKKVKTRVKEGEPVEVDLRLKRARSSSPCYTGFCDAEVFIYTKPPGAKIYLDGRYTGRITKPSSMDPQLGSLALSVPKGRHWISARRGKTASAERQITVKAGEVYNRFRERPLVLRAAKGSLEIDSVPQGALVRLNGELVGKTPLKKKGLAARPYWLELIAEGHQSREELITIEKGKRWRKKWRLTSSTAGLTVKVTYRGDHVEGAAIWLDDQKLGETSEQGMLVIDQIDAGEHLLQVRHPLYEPASEPLDLSSGRRARRHIRMSGAFGYLTIDTSELVRDIDEWQKRSKQSSSDTKVHLSDFTILWGGVTLGKLPFVKTRVSAGLRWLQVRPPPELEEAYGPFSKRYSIGAGETKEIKPKLKRFSAPIELKSGKVRAVVSLDGERRGTTPFRGKIQTGLHTIELTMSDYQPYKRLIWVTRAGWREEVDFKKRTTLALSCHPFAGELSIDGILIGASPQLVDVMPGQHEVSCRSRGAEISAPVDISQGSQLSRELTITPDMLGAAYQKRRWWRQGGGVTAITGGLMVLVGVLQLNMQLPDHVSSRENARQQWLVAADPVMRQRLATSWAESDADAQNTHTLGWSLIGSGALLAGGGAAAWWFNQE